MQVSMAQELLSLAAVLTNPSDLKSEKLKPPSIGAGDGDEEQLNLNEDEFGDMSKFC